MRSPALAAAVSAAVVIAAALWSVRPAAPRPADVPATAFSAERAWPVVERLARSKRVAGSPEADEALRFLESELRAIPGLEVEVQELTAFAHGPYSGPSLYTVRNLLARLPGGELPEEAVLVAAHYDSAVMSHGAADDSVGCAAVVEAARCLAAGPRPRRSVVFLLDEAEELGLFGAQGFLHHRWARDVVTYLNLEAAGCGGRPILFQSGPGDPWLASAYARAAPHPHGTVMGQDVFQSGVIPSDTDFRVYRDDAGLRGLDVALYRDGWGYHTTRDRIERLERGSLQEMGDNTVAVLRELASMAIPSDHVASPAVYYDVLGVWMASYGETAAWLLALIALLSLAQALRVAGRERGVGVTSYVTAAAWCAAALGAAVAVAVALASVLDLWREGVSGWYARPWLAVVAYGVPAAVTVLAVLRLAVLRSPSSPVTAATRLAGGAGVLLAGLLAAMTCAGLGSGYLALWWVVGATAALRLGAHGRLATAAVVGGAFPALLTAQAADALLVTFVPIAGRMSGPMEHVIGLLAALPVALGALVPGAFVAAAPPRWGRPVGVAAVVVSAVACAGVAAWFPYTAERPRRVHVHGEVRDGQARWDAAGWPGGAPELPDEPGLPAARVVVLGDEPAPEGAVRRVRVRVEPNGATGVVLHFGSQAVARVGAAGGAAWVRPDVPAERLAHVDSYAVALVAPPREGLNLTLDLLVPSPELRVRAWHVHMPPRVQERLDAAPPWVTPEPSVWVWSIERL